MRRRHWFIGIFSSRISSAARLPRLSSPAMKDDWIYEREKENRYKVLAGGEKQKNSCEWRCVRGQNHWLIFEDLRRRGGRLRTCKRQPQLIEGEAPLHQRWREYGARWLRTEDRVVLLMKAMFLDLIRFRLEVWDRLFQIGSLAETRSTIRRWRVWLILHKARVNI